MLAAGFATAALLFFGWWTLHQGVVVFEGWKPRISFAEFKRPSLDRPTVFPENFDDNAKKIYNENLERVKKSIRDNPTANDAWMDLAIVYRMISDHKGAVEIWEYQLARDPDLSVPLHNLGEYYFHYAKDYPKAEQYYVRSIELSPDLTQNYYDLFDMYRYVYKQDTTAAADILEKGQRFVSGEEQVVFKIMLGQYYLDKGDKASAKTAWQEALKRAQEIKSAEQVKQVQLLLSTVK
jgi:tetratricopeptide (TPR) repeat protein